ncbi:alpha-2-macroglobulin-like protein 1 [Engraulis encrasicolus]|uniref:alpha-2-macroglobulin-like protein 1 n=1 Tax=Engraulis encrasicolus TaxID=184585 RepID=UPI002FD10E44
MSIYLADGDQKNLLHQQTADKDLHHCFTFQAPVVHVDSLQSIRAEVQGRTHNWTRASRIKFTPKDSQAAIFIQTDKPIYSPGQTVHFRLVTMDTNFIALQQTYQRVSLQDHRRNSIGQWLNVTSERSVVTLSHQLNPEAPQGTYSLTVNTHTQDKTHTFQVKKYVLPKFDVTVESPEKLSIAEEEIRLKACAKYTFGQPVPGTASMSLCRDKYRKELCVNETVQLDQFGCATPVFAMATMTHPDVNKKLSDVMTFKATVAEEGTGISRSATKDIQLDYVLGKAFFVDTPDEIEKKAVLHGKIRAVHYNGTVMAFRAVYLFTDSRLRWDPRLRQNLTTDATGDANFTLDTALLNIDYDDDLRLIASLSPEVDWRTPYRVAHYTYERKKVDWPKHPSSDSTLEVQAIEGDLPCGEDSTITVKYYFTRETFKQPVDIIYVVTSKGEIVHHGFTQASVVRSKHWHVAGDVSFKLPVRPHMSPSVQVVVYCVLPSEIVVTASNTFAIEKCFSNKVSVQFWPPRAVPGEQGSLQLSAQPGSLCGLSAVDQSVSILEPGKRLNATQVTMATTTPSNNTPLPST